MTCQDVVIGVAEMRGVSPTGSCCNRASTRSCKSKSRAIKRLSEITRTSSATTATDVGTLFFRMGSDIPDIANEGKPRMPNLINAQHVPDPEMTEFALRKLDGFQIFGIALSMPTYCEATYPQKS